MRLARFLAASGLGSRRRCEDCIRQGRVAVNGQPVLGPALDVDPECDRVTVDGRAAMMATPRYLLLYKPRGYTCSARDDHARRLVGDLLPASAGRVFTVGRLDRESEGLLLLTNDGALAQSLAHPSHGVEKRYEVWCRGSVTASRLAELRQGITDAGERLRPRRVRRLGATVDGVVLEFVLAEGRKREVRRLCAYAGLTVQRLVRRAVGPLTDAGLKPGQIRPLTAAEVQALRQGGTPATTRLHKCDRGYISDWPRAPESVAGVVMDSQQ